MTHPQTVADIQRLIDELDRHMDGLKALMRQGEKIRAELVQQLALLTARNDASDQPQVGR